MPSRIEELIAWGRKEVPRLCKLGNQLATARAEGVEDFSDMLERAYREEVVPLVQILRDLQFYAMHSPECSQKTESERDIACSCGLTQLRVKYRAILRRFDAPAGTEPKPTAEEKEYHCPKHSPKGIVCDCDLAAEEPRT